MLLMPIRTRHSRATKVLNCWHASFCAVSSVADPDGITVWETLGLVSVQYPKLNLITTRRVAVEQAGLSLEEWHSFLKTALVLDVNYPDRSATTILAGGKRGIEFNPLLA